LAEQISVSPTSNGTNGDAELTAFRGGEHVNLNGTCSARPKLPQLKSSKLLIRLADWKIVAVRYWLHFDGDIEE
jgi:hypothetical protein